MGRRRKNRPKELTREELVVKQVNELLLAEKITPMMVLEMYRLGHSLWRQGMGLPWETVVKQILVAFEEQGRTYLHPLQMAALRGRECDYQEDFQHLKE